MSTTAKIVTVKTPQPPIPQPDKEETFVELRITMQTAQLLRSLGGKEVTGRQPSGVPTLSDLFRALQVAGVSSHDAVRNMTPVDIPGNGWCWAKKF